MSPTVPHKVVDVGENISQDAEMRTELDVGRVVRVAYAATMGSGESSNKYASSFYLSYRLDASVPFTEYQEKGTRKVS